MIGRGWLRRATWIARAKYWFWGGIVISQLLAACSTGAAGAEMEEASFIVGDAPRLVVEIANGRIVVESQGSGGNAIVVSATINNPERVEYSAIQEDDTVKVIAEINSRSGISNIGREGGVDVVVSVPQEIALQLRTGDGETQVSGVTGPVSVTSSNGSMSLSRVQGRMDLETSNGRISVDDASGEVNARTSNGRIELRNFAGQVDAQTSNGSIAIEGTLPPGSQNKLQTSNGSVDVTLIDTAGVLLDASTSNGKVSSTLPITIAGQVGDDHLVGTIGNGGSTLEIRTSSGSVTIR